MSFIHITKRTLHFVFYMHKIKEIYKQYEWYTLPLVCFHIDSCEVKRYNIAYTSIKYKLYMTYIQKHRPHCIQGDSVFYTVVRLLNLKESKVHFVHNTCTVAIKRHSNILSEQRKHDNHNLHLWIFESETELFLTYVRRWIGSFSGRNPKVKTSVRQQHGAG